MALPENHLAKFHKMTDAKEMWDAIKSRFGGNDESKKMQKYILKQQFEGFSVSNSEGLHKGYGRFQSLLSQLEIHEAGVSTEDANQKFLRSLPSASSQVSLIMRTKPGVDSLRFNDLYNNLRVFENDVKGSTTSPFNTQNVAFISENAISTNDISTAYGVSNPSGHNSQINGLEMAGSHDFNENEKNLQKDRTKGNQDSKRRDAWNSGNKDGRRSGKQEDTKALVTIDGEGVDWTSHLEEEEDYALTTCNSSDTEVTSCSKECKESYVKLKKLYDEQRTQLSDASIEIQAYTQGLKKVEAQLVAHQQGQLWYEKKIRFMKIDLDDKTDVLTYHKKLLAEAQNEKEDLKVKVEKWHNSSKNLAGGMHVVPPPMTGNYMPSGPDVEIDYSQYTYGPKQSQPSESETQTSDFDTCESDSSEPTVNEPKVVSQPKVWSDAPIIEEYASDSEDKHVSLPTEEQKTPSFANQQVKTYRETVKNQFTNSKNPKVDKKGLGYGDYDFHEKRMPKQAVLNNWMKRNSSQGNKANFGTCAKSLMVAPGAFLEVVKLLSGKGTENLLMQDTEKEDESAQEYVDFANYASLIPSPARGNSKDCRQEKDANDAAEALRKEFAQQTEDLLLQAGAAKPSSTNIVNTASTPVSTTSPDSDLTNPDQDDSEIPALEEIYKNNLLMKISEALEDESWVDAMQEELLQFKIQKVWILVDLPYGKKAIGTKWVYRNKKDERGVVVRNKASYVDDIIFGSIKKSWCDEFEALMKSRFQMSSMGELTFFLGLQVKQKADGIFYMSRSIMLQNPEGSLNFVNVRLASTKKNQLRPEAFSPRIRSHLVLVSRVRSHPKTSQLTMSREFIDSDYAGANLDRKSRTGGCQFLSRRLISWKCKKQTIMATSTIEAEYVVAANCCEQVL
ncbi:ribonuclease H-like domain-containing protein [Tanacetum coccineum]